MKNDGPDLRSLAEYFISRLASADDVEAFFLAVPGASDPAIEAHFHDIVREVEQLDAADGGSRTRVVCDKFRLFRVCNVLGAARALSHESQQYFALYGEWIESDSWELARATLRSQPAMLSDTGRELLSAMAQMQIDQAHADKVVEHLALLDECRASGIEIAFERKFAALNDQRNKVLSGLISKLVFSSTAADWIDVLARHPVLLGRPGSETWLMGWERAPHDMARVLQEYLRSMSEDEQRPPADRLRGKLMLDFLGKAAISDDRLTYPEGHPLLANLDAGYQFTPAMHDAGGPTSPEPVANALEACNDAIWLQGRAAYFSARRAQGAPAEPRVADFMGLRDCRRLGSGGRSRLYVGRDVKGALTVAKFYPAANNGDPVDYERDEARLMFAAKYGPHRWCMLPIEELVSQVRCPDDEALLGWAYTSPWCELGSLRDRLEFGSLDRYERVLLLLNTAICLRGLHEAQIVHGDVKPDNLLFWRHASAEATDESGADCDAHLVLSDLGSSVNLRDPAFRQGMSGTPAYQPPEALLGCEPDFSIDAWAWGVIAIELFTGSTPNGTGKEGPDIKGVGPLAAAGCPSWLRDLIKACQSVDPKMRPSAAEIVRAFAEHCQVFHDAASASRTGFRKSVFRLQDLPGETIEMSPELLVADRTPVHKILASDGIQDTLATTGALMRDNRHESFIDAFRIIHKRFACDGGRGSLMWQMRANPSAASYVNPPTRPLYPNESMGKRVPIPAADAYVALDFYINAIVLVRQHCLDKEAEDAGRYIVEFFGFDQPGSEVAQQIAHTTMLSLLILFGSDSARTPHFVAVAAQLRDTEPYKVASAANIISYSLQANGDVSGAIDVLRLGTMASAQSNEEDACRSACSAAVLCALNDDFQSLLQIMTDLVSTSIWNTVRSTDLWQLAWGYLDSGYRKSPGPLLPLRDLLMSGTFFVKGASVARLWLGCACLVRLGESQAAVRIAGVLLKDERLALPFNVPIGQALQKLAQLAPSENT